MRIITPNTYKAEIHSNILPIAFFTVKLPSGSPFIQEIIVPHQRVGLSRSTHPFVKYVAQRQVLQT